MSTPPKATSVRAIPQRDSLPSRDSALVRQSTLCCAFPDPITGVELPRACGGAVGVITNGTAVLGLGNIGPLAAKPVMEGKAVLFKKFADLDSFDLEVDMPDPEKVRRLSRGSQRGQGCRAWLARRKCGHMPGAVCPCSL